MGRPRLLLVPQLTELEWLIRPLLEEWADVACYDAPGVGVRQLFNLTGGEETVGGYDEQMVDGFLNRVPLDLLLPFWDTRTFEGERIAQTTAPMLLAQHKGCLLYTPEGFDDAVAAFPQARMVTCVKKPSTSPEFADVLREFCTSLATAQA